MESTSMDGFEVCRRVRQNNDLPILFLTAKDDETDRLVGLHIGADDYLTKPFNIKELVALVYARLRRVRGEIVQASTHYVIGDLHIDKEKYTVYRGTEPILLTPTEFNMLEVLSSSPDRVYSRLQLMDTRREYFLSSSLRY